MTTKLASWSFCVFGGGIRCVKEYRATDDNKVSNMTTLCFQLFSGGIRSVEECLRVAIVAQSHTLQCVYWWSDSCFTFVSHGTPSKPYVFGTTWLIVSLSFSKHYQCLTQKQVFIKIMLKPDRKCCTNLLFLVLFLLYACYFQWLTKALWLFFLYIQICMTICYGWMFVFSHDRPTQTNFCQTGLTKYCQKPFEVCLFIHFWVFKFKAYW